MTCRNRLLPLNWNYVSSAMAAWWSLQTSESTFWTAPSMARNGVRSLSNLTKIGVWQFNPTLLRHRPSLKEVELRMEALHLRPVAKSKRRWSWNRDFSGAVFSQHPLKQWRSFGRSSGLTSQRWQELRLPVHSSCALGPSCSLLQRSPCTSRQLIPRSFHMELEVGLLGKKPRSLPATTQIVLSHVSSLLMNRLASLRNGISGKNMFEYPFNKPLILQGMIDNW